MSTKFYFTKSRKAAPPVLLLFLLCPLFFLPVQGYSQQTENVQDGNIIVNGTVKVQEEGQDSPEGMPGVTVRVKGTTKGTATDVEGNFRLSVPPDAELVFTMVGYKPKELPATAEGPMEVILEEDVSTLKEVVVTGYQTIDRKLFTGSAATLDAEDIKREGVTDVSRMLEGRVAGVSIQNVSGTFGAAPKIRVRGATSITGDNKPLWVVDGVILEDVVNVSNEQLSTGDPATLIGSSVAGLNPDDIESFQILKDASATAMYGARAMNGVVVITTKKGRVGKPLVSYTGNFSTYLKPTYRSFDIMNSADQMSVYLEMYDKGWFNYSDVARNQNGGVFSKMADYISLYAETNRQEGVENTTEGKMNFLRRYALANTDWFDVLFRNSFMQEHSLSISSGSEKSQLYFSTSYLQDNGWTIADHVQRFTGNARANFNLSDKIKIGLITQGSIREQQAPGTISRVSNPVSGQFDRDFDINPFSYALNTSRTLTVYDEEGELEYFRRNFAPFNILNELENNTLDLSILDLKLQGDFSYEILPNLKYSFLGALRHVKTNQEHRVRENANMALAYRANGDATIEQNNKFLYRDPDNPEATPVVVLPYGGFYNTNDDYLTSYNLRNTLEWDKTFQNIHLFHFFASQELRYADRQNRKFTGAGYQYGKGGTPYIDYRIIKQGIEGNFNYYDMSLRYDRFLAYMANAAYSYDGKYNLNGTVRYDGSNLLGESPTARWLPTWNISGSWNIDTEPFMDQQDLVNRLTLRATYGLTASMGNATNSSLVLQNGSTRRPYLTEVESMIFIEALENAELTWEKQYETNVGIDAGFLRERIQLTIDAYLRDAFDLIGPVRTSGIGGQEIKVANYADMESHGLEVTLGGLIVQEKPWSLKTQLTFGYNKGRITNLKNNPDIWSLVIPEGGPKEGYPYRGLFSIDFQGLDPENGSPLFINENGELSGDVYLQSDKTEHLVYEGPIDPLYTGGWFNNLQFGNFSFSGLVTYSGGNKIRLYPAFETPSANVAVTSYSDLDAMPNDFRYRWTLAGDEEWTDVPSLLSREEAAALGSTYPYNNYNYSTARVVDGDFVRLKQLSLSYTITGGNRLGTFGLSNLSFSLVGNNLWLIYADKRLKGQDPEFFGTGGVSMPVPRQLTLSLKAGF